MLLREAPRSRVTNHFYYVKLGYIVFNLEQVKVTG